jgi:hypothetical protein
VYKGIGLENKKTIGDYGINKGVVIDLITPVQTLQIFVKSAEGKKFPLEVSEGDLIRNVKKQIDKKEKIPVEEQGLSYKGKRLQDDHTIGGYGVEKGATLDLVSPLPSIFINVKARSGKIIPLEVNGGDSIHSMKEKIKEKEGL